jgi:hypothetical protein
MTMAFDLISTTWYCAPRCLVCLRAPGSTATRAALASLAADLRVTQVVNGNKGIHVMLDKRYLTRLQWLISQ